MLSLSNSILNASPQFLKNTFPSSTIKPLANSFSRTPLYGPKYGWLELEFPAQQQYTLNYPCRQECMRVMKVDRLLETVEGDRKESNETLERIDSIKRIMGSIEGGRISISPYDTAWVSLLEETDQGERTGMKTMTSPQFPTCLEWVANNQLQDGSWGVTNTFSVYDRLMNTLACIVALKKWNVVHPQMIEKGISFMKENFGKLQNENPDHMAVGFEILFPTLIEMARKLDIHLIDDSCPIMKDIIAQKNLKLAKIPVEVLYKEHTTLHYSLEGITDVLDWEKILPLQCPDGSMLYSPAATAYTLMHTKDAKCMGYLVHLVEIFNGAVPNVYPVDMFARNFSVDRLQRLGISRYFLPEIRECLDYVLRHWTDKGIYTISHSPFYNIDDTSMGFRNLRLHGYEISADAFWNFKHGDAFCCFPRQSTESLTALFNFYRASQLMFPGETVLEEGRAFAYKFLREREANKQIVDKWLICKDLPGEVGYALDVPWYANLPRVETRLYIEQYGGEDDVWISKCLYKMPEVNNNEYLELAKLDFNNCQDQHQVEWDQILEWFKNSKMEESGTSEGNLLLSYFLAAANIFEPERSTERIAWAKSAILVHMIVAFFTSAEKLFEKRKAFVDEFINSKWSIDLNGYNNYKAQAVVLDTLIVTLNQLSTSIQQAHPVRDIRQHSHYLHHAWETWLLSWVKEGVSRESEAELLVRTIIVSSGGKMSTNILSNPQYKHLVKLTNEICLQLHQYRQNKERDEKEGNVDANYITTIEIESGMKELVQLVLQKSSDGIDPLIKQTFLTIAKSFYYTAYCNPTLTTVHITKVLFQPIC